MVEVNYRGGGMDGVTSNAASEATLLRLLAAIEKGGGGGGGSGGKIQQEYNKAQKAGILGQKTATKELKDGAKAQGENTKAVEKNEKSLKNFVKALDRYSMGLVSGIGNTIKGVADLGIELVAGGDRLSDFSKHATGLISKFPVIGGAVGGVAQTFINMIDAQVDSFRELSNAGIDFGGDLFELQRKAVQAGVSMDVLAGALSENSEMLSQAFGGASKGAAAFTRITGTIQQNQDVFSALGMTMADVTEYTADYLEMQKIQGRITQMSEAQLAKGTQEYIMQLDQLSKVTGMSRKQAAEELKQQSNDKRLKTLFATMDEGTKKNVQGVLGVVGKASPQMKEAITELIATGGVPISDFAKSLGRTNPELLEQAKALKEGRITQDDFVESLKEAQAKAQALAESQGGSMSTLSALGSNVYDASIELQSMGFVAGKVEDAIDAQNKAVESGRKGALNFESAITKMRNIIIGQVIESGVFKDLMAQFEKLSLWLSSPEGAEKLKNALKPISDYLGNFYEDVKKLNFKELMEKYIIGPIKRLIFGESKADKKKRVSEEWDAKIASAPSGNKGDMLLQKNKAMADLDAELAKEGDGKGLLDFLIPDIGFKEIVIGMGLVAAAVIGLGLAGKAGSVGLLIVAAAFGGIGYALNGLANLIDAISSSIGKMADGVKKFENLDGDKLLDVGSKLKPLTEALWDLVKSGFVANFIKDGNFSKLSAELGTFENLDPSKLALIGPALTALQKGIASFTGDGILDSASKFFGSLFGNSGGNFKDLAKGLRSFDDVDTAGLKALGDGLQGIATFIEAMDRANIDDVAKGLKELTKELANYQKAYSKLDAGTKASIEKMISVSTEGQKGAGDQMNGLNNIMQEILSELRKQTRGQRDLSTSVSGQF